MIVFRHPWILLLLLLVPLWVWLRHARRRQAPLTFSDGAALLGLPRSPWLALRWAAPALFAAGLVAKTLTMVGAANILVIGCS